ncbi:MAG TPA: thiamine-phosphate kinase [Vicinamibacterales bacterium]|nr:thiamine-phosphate kinase [Vicinamibacterales bacterium]
MSGTIDTVDERDLIGRLHARAGHRPASVVLGIGDDAALLEPVRGELIVLSTDSLVEDVHFRRHLTSPSDIGRKALAVNLSDLAAMGASPRACLLGLALPSGLPLDDFDQLIAGLVTLAEAVGVPLVGGNLARSPGPLVVDVTVVGSVHRRRVLRRAGGLPGDDLYVTGTLGGAAAGLRRLEAGLDRQTASVAELAVVGRHERPDARIRTGRAVARQAAARAAIDLSDGLAAAVSQLAEASGVGAVIDLDLIPVDPGLLEASPAPSGDAPALALRGGEDYELLFAVPPRRRRTFEAAVRRAGETRATRIGRLTAERALRVAEGGMERPLPAPDFAHFGQ